MDQMKLKKLAVGANKTQSNKKNPIMAMNLNPLPFAASQPKPISINI
jgi:hypothetical protein